VIEQRIVYFGCMKHLLVAAGLLLSMQSFAHSTKARLKEDGENAASAYVQKYGRYWGKRVYRKELQTDMTKPMVMDILGEPKEYSNIPTAQGISELWIYKTGNQIKQIVFLNNKVIAVHNLTL
jgi:hypothetical protein